MIHLKRFNESSETFKNTDDAIKEFFIDYIDEDKDNLEIINGWVRDNDFKREAEYIKKSDLKRYKRAKLIKLKVSNLDGIKIDWDNTCSTSLEPLKKAIDDIERFYALSEEEINFSIEHKYDELIVQFVTKGDPAKEDEAKADTIDKFLSELKAILHKRKYHRISDKGNFLDIRTAKKDKDRHFWLGDMMRRIRDGQIQDGGEDDTKQMIIDWRNKLIDAGFTYEISGGDYQVVIKLKKIN